MSYVSEIPTSAKRPSPSPGSRPPTVAGVVWTWVRRALIVLLLTVLQIALVVVAGGFASTPAVAIVVALVVSAVVVFTWTWVGTLLRKRPDLGGRLLRAAGAFAVSAVLTLVVVMPTAPVEMTPPAGALQLADGTYLATRSAGPEAPVPVIAVHGGPGVPWTEHEHEMLERLATDRPVIAYDQIGTGDSARLDHPSGYTFERAVADLGAVIDSTGAARVALLGYSWGAQVALAYAVAHPERVDRLLFLSPGAFPWDGMPLTPGSPQSRLPVAQRLGLYALALGPRNLFGYAMTVVNPELAHEFMPDQEADARYLDLYRAAAPGLVCDGRDVPDAPERLGHYANHGPGETRGYASGVTTETIDRLARHPVLIFRGECDYLDAGIADDYARELPQARVTDVANAGHALLEEPDAVLAEIREFLRAGG